MAGKNAKDREEEKGLTGNGGEVVHPQTHGKRADRPCFVDPLVQGTDICRLNEGKVDGVEAG
jgi:hypothetical protein